MTLPYTIAIVLPLLAWQAHAQTLPSQTFPSKKGTVVVTEVLTGLDHPWSIVFLPDDSGALITERPGHLRLWTTKGGISDPISGVPTVYARSQGGLLDVALAPDFAKS